MQLLTQKEAALLLSVSIKTITRYRKSGMLPTILLTNTAVRIPKVAVEKFIEVSRCQNRQGYRKEMNTGTSVTQKTEEASEIAYGQKIYRQRKYGFRAG